MGGAKAGSDGGLGNLNKLATLAGNFGKVRTLGDFINTASPLLKSGARLAAPMVGTAIGGPLGGLAGKLLLQMLKEGESEDFYELEGEFELVMGSPEALHEMIHEIAHHELAYNEALAEMIAEAAANEQHEAEAEAMAAVAALTTISPEDERALRSYLPHLVSGAAILTRILRQDPETRPAVRVIPTVTRRLVQTLKRKAKSGIPLTRRSAGRAAMMEVGRLMNSPTACATAMAANLHATRALRKFSEAHAA
jgi:hypothetical protein